MELIFIMQQVTKSISSLLPARRQTTDLLVERDFGQALEGKPYEGAYESLWANDAVDLGSRCVDEGVDDVFGSADIPPPTIQLVQMIL
jgi:hypothetical protein